MDTLLDVKNLQVSFDTYAGSIHAVRDVSFDLKKGEAIAIVGESGCGKSVTAQAIMQLVPVPPGRIVSGEVFFHGTDLLKKSPREMERIRGKDIGMIFQDPMTSLNPTMKVGKQIMEVLIKHQKMSREEAYEQAIEMLRLVHISQPERRVEQYPFEFSGGMRQRVMIAIALACRPQLLIADEPTTALDVTIQAEILELMQELKEKMGTSIILITHDLGVVAGICERVVVMYAGKVVEMGKTDEIFYKTRHPYTQALLKAVPRLDIDKSCHLEPILGTPPSLLKPPNGCSFCARCDFAMEVCQENDPSYTEYDKGHKAACWLAHEKAALHRKNFLDLHPLQPNYESSS